MIKPFRILDTIMIPSFHDIVVHCDTIEKAGYLLKHLHKLGYQWNGYQWDSKDSLLKKIDHYYANYGSQTCYRILTKNKRVTYGEISYYCADDYEIYEFEEVCGCSLDVAIELEDMLDTTSFRALDIIISANYKTIINCQTREEAKKLLNHLDKLGYTWACGDPLDDHDFYNTHGDKTFYMICGKKVMFGDMDTIDDNGEIDKDRDIILTFKGITGTC